MSLSFWSEPNSVPTARMAGRISRLLRDGVAVEKLRASKDAAALYAMLTEEAASHAA